MVMERADLLAAVLPTLRSDLALVESHRPAAGTRLTCPITAFGGVDDTIDSVSLQAWSEYTAASFRVRMFPGGHFYLSEVGRALVDEIVSVLRKPCRRRGSPEQQYEVVCVRSAILGRGRHSHMACSAR